MDDFIKGFNVIFNMEIFGLMVGVSVSTVVIMMVIYYVILLSEFISEKKYQRSLK